MYNRGLALSGLGAGTATLTTPPLTTIKMQAPEPGKSMGGAYKDIWINPPHVDEKSLPGYDVLLNGPGDARERWLKFRALNPRIDADITNAFRYQNYAALDSATERLEARRDNTAERAATVSKYGGIIIDTYYAWRAIEVAEYHAEHEKSVKRWKVAIAVIATAAVATSFLGASATNATASAGAASTGGAAGGAGAAAGSSILTPITVAAKPLTIVGGKVMTAAKAASAISTASSVLQPVTVAAKPLSVASITAKATELAPKVIGAVNTARTVTAIAKGEIPPPPISLEGDSFTDYATSVATDLMQKKLQAKMTAAQTAEMENEVRRIQALAISQLPPNYSAYPMPTVSAPVQSAMLQSKEESKTLQTALLLGIPILLAVIFKG